jgi:hypothetical protein
MNVEGFVSGLCSMAPAISRVVERIREDWAPQSVPRTTLLAEIGDAIADDLAGDPTIDLSSIFGLVETAMESSDDELRTAVSTGLIESLATRASSSPHLHDVLAIRMGPLSVEHMRTWLSG